MCMPMKMPDRLLMLLVPLKCAALIHLVSTHNRFSPIWVIVIAWSQKSLSSFFSLLFEQFLNYDRAVEETWFISE